MSQVYIAGNVSPNTIRTHTFGHCFFSLSSVIAQKRQFTVSLVDLWTNIDVTVADDVSLLNGTSAEEPMLAAAGLPTNAKYS